MKPSLRPSFALTLLVACLMLSAAPLTLFGQSWNNRFKAAARQASYPQATGTTWVGLQGLDRIDDIAVYSQEFLLIFKGPQYYWYRLADNTISAAAPLTAIPGWPGFWAAGIDAAVEWDASTILLFRGDQYIRYDIGSQAIAGAPVSLRNWAGWPAFWTNGVQAAARWDDRTLLLFSGSQYVIYDIYDQRFKGTPLPLSAWIGWPAGWTGLDAAVTLGDGKVYFFRGPEYVQFDVRAGRMDVGSPHPFTAPPVVAQQQQPPVSPGSTGSGLVQGGAPQRQGGQSTSRHTGREETQAQAREDNTYRDTNSRNDASTQPANPGDAANGSPLVVVGGGRLPIGTASIELKGTRGQGVTAISDQRLVPGSEGTIEFWVAARWDPAAIKNPPVEVLKLGSTSKTAWSIFITAERDRVGLFNGEGNGEGQEEWEFDFSDGALHHVALATAEQATELFIDGRSLGERPVGYRAGNTGSVGLPLSIGPFPFAGGIAGVRLWNTRLSDDSVKLLRETPISDLARRSEYASLVGYLEGGGPESSTSGQFKLLPASYPVEGTWSRDGDRVGARKATTGVDRSVLFKPVGLITLRLLPGDHPLAQLGAGVGYVSGLQSGAANSSAYHRSEGGKVLVMMKDDPDTGKLEVRTLQASGRNQYQSGSVALKLVDAGRLQMGQTLYRRATVRAKQQERITASFEKGYYPPGLEYTERGYHLPRLSPWDYRETGSERKIFLHQNQASTDFDFVGEFNIPRGLHYEQDTSAMGKAEETSTFTTSTYYEATRFGVGVSASAGGGIDGIKVGGGFALNTKFRNAIERMKSEEKMHRIEWKECKKYDLVLDRANATLDLQFVEAVQELKRSGNYAGFVDEWGTHYAHGVVYGAKGLRDISITKNAYQKMAESTFDIEAALHAAVDSPVFEAKAEVSGSYGQDNRNQTGGSNLRHEENSESVGWTGPMNLLSCESKESIMPVRLDLRPLDELLGPPFFDDPEIITRVREGLRQAITQVQQRAQAVLAKILSGDQVFDPELIRTRVANRKRLEKQNADRQAQAQTEAPKPKSCPAKTYRYEYYYAFVEFNLPTTVDGQSVKYLNGKLYAGWKNGCNRIWWSDVEFTCQDGQWQQGTFSHDGDGLCHGSYNWQQPHMKTGLKD